MHDNCIEQIGLTRPHRDFVAARDLELEFQLRHFRLAHV